MGTRALKWAALSAFLAWAPAAADNGAPPVGPNKAYVSNTGDGTITVVDLDTMFQVGLPLDVGNGPRGGAVFPDQSKVYIVNQQANDVMVIDTATDQLITRTPVGGRPFRCGISPDGGAVYAACHTSHDVWKLLTADNTATSVFTVQGGGMQDAKVSPDGSRVLAMNNASDEVDFFRTADDQIIGSAVAVGDEPHAVAFSGDGTTAIVVGEGDTKFIDVATGGVVATVPANGEHEEIRVFGNLAYATNMGQLPAPVSVGGPKTGSASSNGIDVFDMTTHQLLRSIPMGGDGANGIELSPDGKRAWVCMRNSNELREVNLVTELETGRNLPVGAAPRCVTGVFKPAAQLPFFLPRTLTLSIDKKGSSAKDSLVGSGYFDDGGAVGVDYTSQPVTVRIGGYQRSVTLVANKKRTKFTFKDATLNFALTPNVRKASLGLYTIRIAKTPLGALIDASQPLEFHFAATGLPDATGTVRLTSGKYKRGSRKGDIFVPHVFPAHVIVKLGGQGKDTLILRGGFASGGTSPQSLGTVRITFGPTFGFSVPGGAFKRVKKTDTWQYRAKVGKGSVFFSVDFTKDFVAVSATNIELGPLSGETTDFTFDAGDGAGAFRSVIHLSNDSKGRARNY